MKKELEKKFKNIDVIVVASSQETMSLVAVEAMMHSKVCIVSNAAGITEYIEQGVNGLICKTNSVNSLVEQMAYCIENKDKLKKMGGN